MNIKNLHFFDKSGYELNFNWNETINRWEGNIYLPKISVGLYANTSVYVLEKIDDEFRFPTGKGSITFEWDNRNKYVDEFFMFTFDSSYIVQDTSSLVYTPQDGPDCEPVLINRFDNYEIELEEQMESSALPIHVAFSSPEQYDATTFKRTLMMRYGGVTIAEITFYAETVEEDERLKVWNYNLGYNITPEDEMIFAKSNINECKPDYQLLNEKRKELLIEGHNIYPYVGSYKALVNAIKFFGYDNLNIVEFWRNVNQLDENFGKVYKSSKYSLTKKETIRIGGCDIPLPNRNYRKMNCLALVYDINRPNGEKDMFELPYVDELFKRKNKDGNYETYTIEEALIKLFALKTKLNKEFMPGSSKIIDVIGEASYFGINSYRHTTDYAFVNDVSETIDINIDAPTGNIIHITSNRPYFDYIHKITGEKDTVYKHTTIDNILDKKISEISYDNETGGCILDDIPNYKNVEYYKRFLEDNSRLDDVNNSFEYYDNLDYSNDLSAKVIIENTSFDNLTFDDVSYKFGDDGLKFDTIKNRKYKGYTKIIWTINRSENQIDDDYKNVGEILEYEYKEFNPIVISGDIETFGKIFFELPYLGYYDVVVQFVNENTKEEIKKVFKKYIKVEPYNIDIRGFFYDARELDDSCMKLVEKKIEDEEKPEEPEKSEDIDDIEDPDITDDDSSSSGNYTDFVEYNLYDENYDCDSSNFEYDSDDPEIHPEPEPEIPPRKPISIGDCDFFYDNVESADEYVKNKLIYYTKLATAEHKYSKNIDMSMPYYNVDTGELLGKGPYYYENIEYEWYMCDNISFDISLLKPNIEQARYIKNGVDVKPYTWLLLTYDYSKIVGKKNPHWEFKNTINGDTVEYDGRIFTLLVKEEGDYSVTVTMEDILGNKYSVTRNILVVDKNSRYNIYTSFKKDFEALSLSEAKLLEEVAKLSDYEFNDEP